MGIKSLKRKLKAKPKPATISVCMMVKNGGELFCKALDSVKDWADEIIVVNTDDSRETPDTVAAIAVNAKVYHHPWENNFSKHRNQSFGYATKDWILQLDADEQVAMVDNPEKSPFLAKSSPETLKDVLGQMPDTVNACCLQLEDYQGGKMAMTCNMARIYRRGKVTMVNRVHNQPIFDNPPFVLPHLIHLNHYGYDLDKDKMTDKSEGRSKPLLLKQLEEEPENLQTPFYLCQLEGMRGNVAESIKWGEQYLGLKDKLGEMLNLSVYFTMVKNYQAVGRLDDAINLAREGLQAISVNPDLAIILSDLGANKQDLNTMADGARRYLMGWDTWAANPAAMGGWFYFSLRHDVRREQLFRMGTVSAHELRAIIDQMKPYCMDDNKLLDVIAKNWNAVDLGCLADQLKEA